MMGEPIETSCVDGKWRNSVGSGLLSGEYDSRESAVEVAREVARLRGVAHVIRAADGSVHERNQYPRRSEELPG